VSKSIYIFNTIIFENIKEQGFEKFQKSKSPSSTCAHVHMVLSVEWGVNGVLRRLK
jgi:F0F1-type ATP synthase membrane subunit a